MHRFTFDVPDNLWLSSNRMPGNKKYLHRIAVGLHEIAGWSARQQHPGLRLDHPVRALWVIQYPKGTGRADASNAQPTTKRLLDGLVHIGLLLDDDDEYVKMESFVRGRNLTTTGPLRKPARRIRLTLTPAAREEYPR